MNTIKNTPSYETPALEVINLAKSDLISTSTVSSGGNMDGEGGWDEN